MVIQVTGAFCGGSAANRGGKENRCGERMSGRQRGIAGGKNNYQPGASGLVKKPLSCTVSCAWIEILTDCAGKDPHGTYDYL